MDEQHLAIFQKHLHFLTERFIGMDKQYFGTTVEFFPLEKDIFGNYFFGYGKCGYMVVKDYTTHIHFELCEDVNANFIALTTWLLFNVFNHLIYDDEHNFSSKAQLLQIDTICQRDLHGHSLGGWVSEELGKWLKEQGKIIPKEEESAFATADMPEVATAIRQTWNALTNDNLTENSHGCYARINCSGRFSLNCPGNACDVSIYPDQMRGEELGERLVQFSSHNLDSAPQQIALLAGLAKLCELARGDV